MASRRPLLRPLPLRLGLASCALVLVVWSGLWWTGRSDGRLHLIFPAQAGDGILIKGAHGEIAVVDGGADGAAFADWLGRTLPLGRRRIDLLLLTRADSTTLPGQLAAVRRYSVGRAVLVRPVRMTAQLVELIHDLGAQHTPVHMAAAGDQIVLGAVNDPGHAQVTILAADDGRLLVELRAMARRVLLLQSAGAILPDVPAGDPIAALVVPWNRRVDDPALQGLRPEAIVFGEQPGNAPPMTLAERRLGTARLLQEELDGEIDLRLDRSGMRIATRMP